ncbi:lantibiotic dehydratase [Clostridium sardiniense]|uniref:lantibiotic dehydratase n=1 Tax=Clostridium sardiniense TaxID=29369 RepID=UPI00195DE9CF|nr:lantibiotic dehydratase [Clostridium sardiniense]MBM7836471.1 thiopeptide-type bacteriocin biosynthesis protein [Clostridium sardiniense]
MVKKIKEISNEIHLTPFTHFALRVPAYSINMYLDKENCDFYDIFQNDSYFREAIFWASPDLYNSIVSSTNKSIKNKKMIDISLKNYYKRMSSRATPFGIFSGFTVGKFSNKTMLEKCYNLKKIYRISYVWLLDIIKEMESNYKILRLIKAKFNENVYIQDNRLYVYDNMDTNSISSIEYTEQVNNISKFAETPINIESLVKKMIEIYGIEFKDQIINLILGLVKNRYLISEFREEDIKLKNIINILEQANFCNEYVKDLKVIDELVLDLNISQRFNEYKCNKLINIMRKLNKTTDYIQVDTKIEDINISINSEVTDSLCEACKWMWNMFGCSKEYKEQKDLFLSRFIDRYGENIKVPIRDLYMNDLGLENIINSFRENNSIEFNKINTFIIKKMNDCMLKKEKEIELSDINLDFKTPEKDIFISDMEIYGRLISINIDGKDDFKFIINNSNYGDNIGASFGRFCDLIDDDDFFINLNKLYTNENIEYLQLLHQSHDSKLQNVIRNLDILDKNMKLNIYDDKSSIGINDISVIYKNNRLYLWSNKLKKQVKIAKLHMLNYTLMPNIYKLILIIDRFNESIPNMSIFNELTCYSYSPRIKYKKIILKPFTWTIRDYFLDDFTEEGWRSYFKDFKITNQVDKYVSLLKYDNKLLINTEDREDIEFLFDILRKEKMFVLEEIYSLSEHQLIERGNGKYLSEVIIPIKNDSMKNNFINNPKDICNHESYLLGENYVYIKLYVDKNNMDLIITDYLYSFIETLLKNLDIDEMFFIRYEDDLPHLRIRLKGNKENLLKIIPEINKFFNKLNEFSLSNDISFNLYNPEIIRYGGKKYFKFVEQYFYYDSLFVMRVLLKIKNKSIKTSIESILVAAIINMFNSMGLSYEECCEFIDINDKSKKDIINYRDYRNEILNIITNNNEIEFNKIRELIYEKDKESNLKKLREINDKNYMYSIVNSLIHMSCNRFNFSDILFEIKVRELLRCALRDLKFWRNHIQ